MEYIIRDYFKERKFLLVTLYCLSAIVLLGFISYIFKNISHGNDSYYYTNNTLVNMIPLVVLICLIKIFLIVVYKILFEFKLVNYHIPMVNNLILLVVSWFVIALLVWYEFYIATMYYHGEVKILSGYLIFTSIVLSIVFTIVLSDKLKHVSLIFIVFTMLSYFFYECQLVILTQYIDLMNILF